MYKWTECIDIVIRIRCAANLLLFAFFQLFSTKNAENEYCDQRFGCTGRNIQH